MSAVTANNGGPGNNGKTTYRDVLLADGTHNTSPSEGRDEQQTERY